MLKKCPKTLVLPMKNTRLTTTLSPPTLSPFSLHLVYIQNVPVYAGTSRTCVFNMCAWCRHTQGFSACHTPHPTHHNPPQPPHHTETDRERQKQGEKRRRKGRRQRRQDNRRENREDSFSVWWCMAVFCWCSDFPVNSVCARDFSLLNNVTYDSF